MFVRKFGVLDTTAASAQLHKMLRHWSTFGLGMWVVTVIATDTFAGEGGLRWLEDGTDVELSYGFYPQFRGHSLASETAHEQTSAAESVTINSPSSVQVTVHCTS